MFHSKLVTEHEAKNLETTVTCEKLKHIASEKLNKITLS